jgi:3-dehydroquinate synthase
MFELGADRKSLVINLGGGVVTDLGGFVASTLKEA